MAFLINYFYCEMQVDEHFVIHAEIKISRVLVNHQELPSVVRAQNCFCFLSKSALLISTDLS